MVLPVNRIANVRRGDKKTGKKATTRKARVPSLATTVNDTRRNESSCASYSYDDPCAIAQSGFGRLYLCSVKRKTVRYT